MFSKVKEQKSIIIKFKDDIVIFYEGHNLFTFSDFAKFSFIWKLDIK